MDNNKRLDRIDELINNSSLGTEETKLIQSFNDSASAAWLEERYNDHDVEELLAQPDVVQKLNDSAQNRGRALAPAAAVGFPSRRRPWWLTGLYMVITAVGLGVGRLRRRLAAGRPARSTRWNATATTLTLVWLSVCVFIVYLVGPMGLVVLPGVVAALGRFLVCYLVGSSRPWCHGSGLGAAESDDAGQRSQRNSS